MDHSCGLWIHVGDLWCFNQSELCSLMFVNSFCHKVRATFYKQIIPCENQRGFLAAVPLTACCHPRNVYRKKCWPTKPQILWHIYLCEIQPSNTRLRVLHYSIWSSCSFKSSQRFAFDSDLLHNVEFNMGPYRKQTSTKPTAHCANAHAFERSHWLDAPLRPASHEKLSGPRERQSYNTVNSLHL